MFHTARHLSKIKPVGARSIFTSTKPLHGDTYDNRRAKSFNKTISWGTNNKRMKIRKGYLVSGLRNPDGERMDFGPATYSWEDLYKQAGFQKRVETPDYANHRTFGLRKRFLYNRCKNVIAKAYTIMVVQPPTEQDFEDLLERVSSHFYTVHLKNGLVSFGDRPVTLLKKFFKGPIRPLLSDNPNNGIECIKKLRTVLKDFPHIMFVGGAIGDFAGMTHELEALCEFDSEDHIKATMISLFNAPSQICPVMDYAPKSLARVLHHHGEQVQKPEGADATA